MLYCFTNRLVPATGAFMPTMRTYFWLKRANLSYTRTYVHTRTYIYIYVQDTYPHTQYWFQYLKKGLSRFQMFFYYYYYFQNCAKVYNSHINGLARDLFLLFVYFTSLHSYWWWCRSDELPTKVSVCQYIRWTNKVLLCHETLSLSLCGWVYEREREKRGACRFMILKSFEQSLNSSSLLCFAAAHSTVYSFCCLSVGTKDNSCLR